MGILRETKDKKDTADIDKSIYISDARIDRAGNEWKRKSIWLRQEYLGKLKVMSHFQDRPLEALIDEAVAEYVSKNFDNSMAMKKMVEKSTGQIPTTKV